MANHPFRFIHAADLHLESPVTGLSYVPEHLRQLVLDAPKEAAARVFDQALTEKVDFLLLSGNVLAPSQTGAWGPLFLLEQFEKLHMEGIPVYWVTGRDDDPDDWPAVLELPENVHRFPVGEPEEVIFQRDNIPVARILGVSQGKAPTVIHPAEFPADADGLYSIGMATGKFYPEAFRGTGMQYWALGGQSRRETISQTPSIVHYPGTTLARSPLDRNDAGVTLVEFNEYGRTNLRSIRTTPITWTSERIVIRGDLKEDAILEEMRNRIRNLRKGQENPLLFIDWKFEVPTEMIPEIRNGNLATTLLRDLRSDFGKEPPIVYSLDLEPIIPETLESALYDQQTILGDFLRITHFYQENPDQEIRLSDFFPEEMKDYLESRLAFEKYKANKNDADSSNEEALPEQFQWEKSFRSDIPYLIHLLSLSVDEQEGYRRTFTGEKLSPDAELLRRIATLRSEALKEAGTLGAELLTGQPEEVRRAAKMTVKTDPRIALEQRNLLDYKERKESLS